MPESSRHKIPKSRLIKRVKPPLLGSRKPTKHAQESVKGKRTYPTPNRSLRRFSEEIENSNSTYRTNFKSRQTGIQEGKTSEPSTGGGTLLANQRAVILFLALTQAPLAGCFQRGLISVLWGKPPRIARRSRPPSSPVWRHESWSGVEQSRGRVAHRFLPHPRGFFCTTPRLEHRSSPQRRATTTGRPYRPHACLLKSLDDARTAERFCVPDAQQSSRQRRFPNTS